MKLSDFECDPRKTVDGVWVDYVTGELVPNPALDQAGGPLLLRCARFNNPAFQSAIVKSGTKRQNKRGEADVDLIDSTVIKAACKHLFKGWSCLEGDDGKYVSFTSKKCYEIVSDPRYRDLYEDWIQLCRNREYFEAKDEESNRKNS